VWRLHLVNPRVVAAPCMIKSHLKQSLCLTCWNGTISPITSSSITVLCVTRTRVPHIASTTLAHRNIVNIVISNAHSLLSTLFSHKTQRSNQPYSLIWFDQDGVSQIRAKPRHSSQKLYHKIRLRRPQKGRSKT
jgi:hypothetical protein